MDNFANTFLDAVNKVTSVAFTPEIEAILNRPLPKEALSQHPTRTYLTTIKPIFVVDRLNEAFGKTGWYTDYYIIADKTNFIVVKGYLYIPKFGALLTNYGGNDNADLGDAYKGACTDALTKMGSYLGIGADIWRALKSKPQEYKKPLPAKSAPPVVGKKLLGEKGFDDAIARFEKGEGDIFDKLKKAFELTTGQLATIKAMTNEL